MHHTSLVWSLDWRYVLCPVTRSAFKHTVITAIMRDVPLWVWPALPEAQTNFCNHCHHGGGWPPCSRPPKGRRSCMGSFCLEAVPVCTAQSNVCMSKDQKRSLHPVHQREGNHAPALVLACSASSCPRLLALSTSKDRWQLKIKGCEDHRFTGWPLEVRVSGGFTLLWI